MHFLLLGALLFGIGALRGGDDRSSRSIVVTPERVQQLAAIFERTWQRPPTPRELQALADDYVREEIYVREARAMGLDEGDTIIRRRLRQKLEFLTDQAGAEAVATEEELAGYLDANADRYRIPPRVAFRQVYVSTDRRPDAEDDAERLLAELRRGDGAGAADGRGDRLPFTVPSDRLLSAPEIERLLGRVFARSVAELPVGRWVGPVRSGFGLHLVFVTEREGARLPEVAEIRAELERDWARQRSTELADAFYQRLRADYDIEIQFPAGADGTAPGSAPGDAP